jgi:energy-converting hydrogenase Eha subunit G
LEKKRLNTTLPYVLSILGLLCCCFAGLGVIPSGIAYFISNKQLKEAHADHENYENIDAMKTAKTIALIILIINALYLLYCIYYFSTGGWAETMKVYQEAMEQVQQNQ